MAASVGYHDYEGLTDSTSVSGSSRRWAATVPWSCGTMASPRLASPREAFSPMKEFVRAARIQLIMESSSQPVLEIAPEICEHVAAQYQQHGRGRASAEWPAYLRPRDGIDRSYRD
jgi:hypothetical protein